MVHVGNEQIREGPINWAGHTVTLLSAETGVWVDTRWFAFKATYRRPVRVEVVGDDGARLTVPDFVMLTRIALLVLSMITTARRFLR